MSECPYPSWPFFGETSAPPPSMPQFASSPRNSPRPWGNYNRNYTPFPNTVANNLSSVGSQAVPGNGYEANAPPHCQGSLSGILKQFLCHRIAHPDSEVVAFHTESGTNGKTRVTVTFETNGGA
ncbi:hypothetical protein DFH94DRAFT_697337 [Russula ochroleuca]|uniref:Uncharacterized protein n=1 Tax=Russula ochroleuca TaxID=152965 RepID=A0A9P5JXT1_9AGAM|nr:hypothetical protein DFH94DRAFT_697337 [Russula ochroleuca]